jgi:hypothetical protein
LSDRLADGFGDRHADREAGGHALGAQAADVGQQSVGAAGRVGAYQDVAAVAVRVRDLRQRVIQYFDVVGGGVRPGPTLAQQPGQRLTGVVQETQQRVVAEGAFLLSTDLGDVHVRRLGG